MDYVQNSLGCEYLATGHYINLDRPQGGPEGPYRVLRSVDASKDQTYMLARVKPKDIQRALFPLGPWIKKDVVAYAVEAGIPTAHSKESMDVCFVLDGQANYLKKALGPKPGPIVDLDTNQVVGEHEGHFLFTRGQRKGVGVAAGRPVYVIKTDSSSNTVYIGDKHHLETQTFRVKEVNWLEQPTHFPAEVMVKYRYNTPPSLGTITPEQMTGDFLVTMHKPVIAITPAQIAAFYDATDTQLLGGGFIETHLTHPTFDPSAVTELPDLNCELAPTP